MYCLNIKTNKITSLGGVLLCLITHLSLPQTNNTNNIFCGMILKPQKINQQKINVFFLVKNHRNYLLCGIILQNLSNTFKTKLPTNCI